MSAVPAKLAPHAQACADIAQGEDIVRFLNITGTASLKVQLSADDAAPQLALPGGTRQNFLIGRGIRVQASLVPETLCYGRPVIFSWTTNASTLPATGYSQRDLLLPGPISAAADLIGTGFTSSDMMPFISG